MSGGDRADPHPAHPRPPSEERGSSDLFSPVNASRMSALIIDQIRGLIRTGQLVPGSRLPSERELCSLFGVSRVTVREALRVLEANGLIEVRTGAHGGAVVTAPSSQRIGAGIADLLTLSAISPVDVTEARQILDIGIVPLVCERATADDIDDLFTLCAEAALARDRGEFGIHFSAAFHVRLAQATHNTAIAVLMQSFREPIELSLKRALRVAPAMSTEGIDDHLALAGAVRDRDAVRATRIMAQHLARTKNRLAAAGSPS